MIELAGVTVPVVDMERAITFYAQLLDRPPAVNDPEYSLFEGAGGQLGLLAVNAPVPTGGPQPLWRTDDLEAERARIAAFAREVGEIQEHSGYRLFLFSDLDGNTLEIYEIR